MKEYRTINKIAGPLLFVEKTEPIGSVFSTKTRGPAILLIVLYSFMLPTSVC